MALEDLDPDALYHLASPEEWEAHRDAGAVAHPSLETEGFVHCSWGRQVAGTVERHFGGATGLLALQIDPAAMGEVELIEEDAPGTGQRFPHSYGPIPLVAVIGTVAIS